ncbi:hypothetical protein CQW23_16234 [Capsicum baccatum]|uniref:Uncharacterized protein n=1 Tax=Capsicum baccatum TaxID=33114 RepID=A0A2G2WAK8_CAPBA|nr:hypothetical protein CQW23_16234 [Capsicum baccatum]
MGEMNGGSGILMLRKKMEEWDLDPYCSQMFNKNEPYDWRPRYYLGDDYLKESETASPPRQSFDFSIGTDVVGGVKLCSYSELQQITDFRYESLIGNTLSGRFDQIEFFTNENANTHPKLAKLCTFCCDTRLAAVYDVEFDDNITRLLSDVILEVILVSSSITLKDQLSTLLLTHSLLFYLFGRLLWVGRQDKSGDSTCTTLSMVLHEKGIIMGSITASCILIEDKEMDIKVFDFGSVSDHMHKGVKVPGKYHSGWEAPERAAKMRAKGEKRRRSRSSSSEDGSKGGEAKQKLEAAKTNEAIEAATANEEGSRSS